jgi:hypothetical protein
MLLQSSSEGAAGINPVGVGDACCTVAAAVVGHGLIQAGGFLSDFSLKFQTAQPAASRSGKAGSPKNDDTLCLRTEPKVG